MSIQKTVTFTTGNWDESTYRELAGEQKMNRTEMSRSCSGDFEGVSTVEYLLFYDNPGRSRFVGLERFEGSVDGRSGSFVVELTGYFENGKVEEKGTILQGFGTGDLRDLYGETTLSTGEAGAYQVQYTYGFAE